MSSSKSYQDAQYLKRLFRRRLWAIGVGVLVLSGILFLRLLYLQVWQHGYYSTLSRSNSISLLPIAPMRGLIYDRHGVILAENIPTYSLEITPDQVPDLDATVQQLSQILDISATEQDAFYKELPRKHDYDSIPLKVNLSEMDVAKFAVDQYRFPGVQVQADLIRHYPYGGDFVSALGYIGRINENDLTTVDNSNYAATNYIGKVGIEKYFETQLHGITGYRQVETDASGRAVRILKDVPAVAGNDIYLTIDSGVQETAMKAFQNARGALVAIQPSTGQVLALVSSPSYDPNPFVTGISTQDYQTLQKSPDQPLFNRAIRGQFPFASTIKVFFALELLEGGFTTPKEQIYDPGYFQINGEGHTFHDEHAHGFVSLQRAIEVSCDTYFYMMSLRMGIDKIDEILTRFGFGQYTHIQMGEELPGLVASPEWKERVRKEKWYAGDTVNSSIGQGSMLTTPLQLASAVATIANRGIRYQPNLVLRQVTPSNQVLRSTPIMLSNVQLKPSTWDNVIAGMTLVVSGSEGTAWRFGHDAPYSVAAKTGTGQVYSLNGKKYVLANVPMHLRDNSMFIAFAPVDHPKIAVAVSMQNQPLAPAIARTVIDYYLLQQHHLQLPDQDDTGTTVTHSNTEFEQTALGGVNLEP